MLILVKLSYNFQKRENREISYNLILNTYVLVGVVNLQFLEILNLLRVMELPNKKECLSNVFVGRSAISVDHGMGYLSYPIHISHNVRL